MVRSSRSPAPPSRPTDIEIHRMPTTRLDLSSPTSELRVRPLPRAYAEIVSRRTQLSACFGDDHRSAGSGAGSRLSWSESTPGSDAVPPTASLGRFLL